MGRFVINISFLVLCAMGFSTTFARSHPSSPQKPLPYFRFPPAHYSANKILKPHRSTYIAYHHMKDMKEFTDSAHKKHTNRVNTMEQNPKNSETSFQISGKLLLLELHHFLFFDTISLYFTGTFNSYWQTYVKDPFFRDNDYKPQAFFEFPFSRYTVHAGWVHQSNGKGLPEGVEGDKNATNRERSWDRLYVSCKIQWTYVSAFGKVWYVFPGVEFEDEYYTATSPIHKRFKIKRIKQGPNYNEDIEEFMGFGKVGFSLDFSPQHKITVTKQLSPKHWWKTWQVEYLAPIPFVPAFQIIVKYFNGYGATVTNYNDLTKNWTVGLVLNFDKK